MSRRTAATTPTTTDIAAGRSGGLDEGSEEMKADQPDVRGDRRVFFRTLAGLGIAGGTGALLMRGGAAQAITSAPRAPAPEAAGYRETSHIRKYYDTARG